MRKTIITFIVIFTSLLSINANAQEKALVKGNNLISASVGFGSFSYSSTGFAPIAVSYENIVFEFGKSWSIGVGGFGGIITAKSGSTNVFGGSLCAQSNVHFTPTTHWDIYAGLGLGGLVASAKTSDSQVSTSAFGFAWTPIIGARYFFNKLFGLNLQLGGLGLVNLGVSFKF